LKVTNQAYRLSSSPFLVNFNILTNSETVQESYPKENL
jgi:hypothetical protein